MTDAWKAPRAGLAAVLFFLFCAARTPAADETAYNVRVPSGTIYGTLTVPASRRTVPVVLIVAGSGPTDRDGNSPGSVGANTYKLLAQALAARGIASVRYDKRGIAKSAAAGGLERDLRFSDYVADAEAYVTQLRGDERFSKVAIAGHSEGSTIAILAAQHVTLDALILLDGPGRTFGDVLREQLGRNLASQPAFLSESDAIIESLEAGKTVATVSPELSALFRPSVQPYLMSQIAIDPARELAKVSCPVTIVQGLADLQITPADAQRLKKSSPAATLVTVPGMSHPLKHADSTDLSVQIATVYADPNLPVEPAVVNAIAAALR